jgi:anti-anti-sigma regulatory factor
MAKSQIIGPLTLEFTDGEVVFRFADPDEMVLEVPATLEHDLRSFMEAHERQFTKRSMVFDIAAAPAISSRQLGVLLAVRHAISGGGQLALRGVTDRVRRLLEMTCMEQFFKLA